jgi:GNAT superfamily N-acetyltransferase
VGPDGDAGRRRLTVDSTDPRIAASADAELVTAIITSAFLDDPVWSWAVPNPRSDTSRYHAFWRMFVDGALRYPWTWLTPGGEAVAIWIPPGGSELSEDQELDLGSKLEALVGHEHAAEVTELLDRFDEAHPTSEPHAYLTLLGTHEDHRGRGIGMRLLASTLDEVDRRHLPAYLESTNPANNPRYERVGFRAIGRFSVPGTDIAVTTMWRDPR